MGNLNSGLELWKESGFAEGVEKKFMKELPSFRKTLTSALKDFAKLENEYQNGNYQEPKEPTVLVSSVAHGEILKGIILPQ
jgi:hypothetical protein